MNRDPKWKVTVKANVTAPIEKTVERTYRDIDDAVRIAIDEISEPYGKGKFEIVSVHVEPIAPPKGTS